LSNRDGLPFDEKVEEGYPAIFDLPGNGALPSEKRMKRVFDLDSALVAGIINNALASPATGMPFLSVCLSLPTEWDWCQPDPAVFGTLGGRQRADSTWVRGILEAFWACAIKFRQTANLFAEDPSRMT
jgi:hypothetical protein